MEVLKLQCTSCGSPLEIKPGIDRAVCQYCGMTYLIGRNGDPAANTRTKNADGDNPVDVRLIPLSDNTVVYDSRLKAEVSAKQEGFPFSRSYTDSIYSDDMISSSLDKLGSKVQTGVRFLSCLAYVTGETYTLDIGDLKMDPVYMYYNGERNNDGKRFLPEELPYLVEPAAIYYDPDMLVRQKGDSPSYDKKKNENKNREYDAKVSLLIAKYRMDYTDTVCYSDVVVKPYTRKPLFGKAVTKQRYWAERYTCRSLFTNVTPELARQYLTDEDASRLARMESISCIPEMAAVMYKEFSKDAKYQLEQRIHEKITVEIGADGIVVKNLRNLVTHRQGNRTWQSPQWIEIDYHNYGMSTINDPAVTRYLAAHLIMHLNRMLRENGDPAWKLTGFYGDAKLTLYFYPALKAVGVYNEWV